MIITKYSRSGKDVLHDVHYIAHGRYCRLGSDETPPERYSRVYGAVTQIAKNLTDLDVRVDRVEWSRKTGEETAIKLTLAAADRRGGTMDLVLKEIGYKRIFRRNPETGEMEEYVKPIHLTEDERDVFLAFEEVLAEYVRYGSGQLELEWANDDFADVEKSVLQFAGK